MYGFNSQCGTFILVSHLVSATQVNHLSLAIPLWVGTMSTSQRAMTSCGWEVKAGMVHVWVAGKTV